MPNGPELFQSLFQEQMKGEWTRSDILRPLIYPLGALLVALSAVATAHGPTWLLICLTIFVGVFLLLTAGAYLVFGKKDPNLLRSEKYNLQRLAIERGAFGDNDTGLIQLNKDQAKLDAPTVALPKPGPTE